MSADLEFYRRMLRDTLLTAVPQPTEILYENRSSTPPDPASGNSFIMETMFPLRERLVAIATQQIDVRTEYSVYVPAGGGTEACGLISKAVLDVFPPGLNIRKDGCTIHIVRSERRAGRKDSLQPAWYFVPVSVTWRTFETVPFTA